MPGAVMFTLVEQGGEQVSASVPADDAAHLARATRLVFQAAARQAPLELIRVSPVLSRQTRAQQVRLRFADPGNGLPAGSEGRLRWQAPRPHLPPDVLVRRNGRLGVFVLQANKAAFVPAPGAQEGRPVLSPVAPDALVIRDGQAQLQPDAAVRASQPPS